MRGLGKTSGNVQLMFHLVQADGFTDEDPEIKDVVTELRKLFNFQGYRLLSTSVLNVVLERKPGWAELRGGGTQRMFAGDSETLLAMDVDLSADRASETVRVKVMLTNVVPWHIRANSDVDPVDEFLEASVTIRDSQTVVLGSTRLSLEEPVLILVVTPRFDPK